jgi:hypothetical protein
LFGIPAAASSLGASESAFSLVLRGSFGRLPPPALLRAPLDKSARLGLGPAFISPYSAAAFLPLRAIYALFVRTTDFTSFGSFHPLYSIISSQYCQRGTLSSCKRAQDSQRTLFFSFLFFFFLSTEIFNFISFGILLLNLLE